MASKIEVEVELKSNADKLWKSIRESTTVFPKALPQMYQSVEVLEGDGHSLGSVRLVKYPPGLSTISWIKEKIELVDEGKKEVSYSVIDGDVLKYYSKFKATLVVSSKGDDDGSCVKWWCDFDKASEEFPNPDLIKDFAIKTFQDLDAYILANP